MNLLEKRYKVIADYPGSPYSINDLLLSDSREYYYVDGKSMVKSPELYPAIFKPLAWYEERTAEEMPEYVKLLESGDIAKVDYYDMHKGWVFLIGPPYKDIIVDIEPSTKEEYEAYTHPQTD